MIRLNRSSVFNQGGPEKVGASVFGSNPGLPGIISGYGGGTTNTPMQPPMYEGPVSATPSRGPSPAMGGLLNEVAAMPAPATPSPTAPSVFAMQPQDMPLSDAAMQTGFLAGQSMPSVKKPSVFDRIGDFINSPAGRQALIASAGATMQGGLGAGIQAGLGAYNQYGQQQAQIDAQNRRLDQGDRGLDIDQQRADVDALATDARIKNMAVQAGIDVAKLEEAIRKAKNGERLDELELRIDAYFKDRGIDLRMIEEQGRNARTQATLGVSRANTQEDNETRRYVADSSRTTQQENIANARGTTRTVKDEDGNSTTTVSPNYGEIRTDGRGNRYRLDPFTGRPVRIP